MALILLFKLSQLLLWMTDSSHLYHQNHQLILYVSIIHRTIFFSGCLSSTCMLDKTLRGELHLKRD